MQKRNSIWTSFLRYCKDIANLLIWALWECLITSINDNSITLQETLVPKVFKSTCGKLCLRAKKSTLSLTSFLRFWKFWECLVIPMKNHIGNFHPYIKTNYITHFFLNILQRNIKLVILGNLGMSDHKQLRYYYEFEETFDVYLQDKKSTLSFRFSLRYCKDIGNLIFWVPRACLAM